MLLLLSAPQTPKVTAIGYIAIVIMFTSTAVVLVVLCAKRPVPSVLIILWIAALSTGIILTDIVQLSNLRPSYWPFFVMIVDFSLVLQLEHWVSVALIVLTSVWLIVAGLESWLRFGLFEIPGTPSAEQRRSNLDLLVGCTNLPCPNITERFFLDTTMNLVVLLVDFAATRGFAHEVEKERESMAQTITIVETVAKLLAGYDVDAVASILSTADGSLPAAMHKALQNLESNLRMYRPYLPSSCLPFDSDKASTAGGSSAALRSEPSSLIEFTPSSRRHLQSTKVTLLVANMQDTTTRLRSSPMAFFEWFGSAISAVLKSVEPHRGVVDDFLGDRIFASFNASRPCAVHATNAASSAKDILCRLPEGLNIGLASGLAWCGDTGCAQMRRFSVLGHITSVTQAMERVGRAMDIPILCDHAVHCDSSHQHPARLLPRAVRLEKNVPGDLSHTVTAVVGDWKEGSYRVYDLDTKYNELHTSGCEWMYDLERTSSKWESYNATIRKFLKGEDVKGDLDPLLEERISLLGSVRPLVMLL
eukprot:TRINITY_DN11142_c1_g1_i1.p1 TRINITY_DN11142_c1_g1~~TRINITY_DN11142_c1_g1_i1.p1  ORF type:complete len:533 (+),score=90.36 TRINITY_DN11142_c1_g1_i1:2-1600(+)